LDSWFTHGLRVTTTVHYLYVRLRFPRFTVTFSRAHHHHGSGFTHTFTIYSPHRFTFPRLWFAPPRGYHDLRITPGRCGYGRSFTQFHSSILHITVYVSSGTPTFHHRWLVPFLFFCCVAAFTPCPLVVSPVSALLSRPHAHGSTRSFGHTTQLFHPHGLPFTCYFAGFTVCPRLFPVPHVCRTFPVYLVASLPGSRFTVHRHGPHCTCPLHTHGFALLYHNLPTVSACRSIHAVCFIPTLVGLPFHHTGRLPRSGSRLYPHTPRTFTVCLTRGYWTSHYRTHHAVPALRGSGGYAVCLPHATHCPVRTRQLLHLLRAWVLPLPAWFAWTPPLSVHVWTPFIFTGCCGYAHHAVASLAPFSHHHFTFTHADATTAHGFVPATYMVSAGRLLPPHYLPVILRCYLTHRFGLPHTVYTFTPPRTRFATTTAPRPVHYAHTHASPDGYAFGFIPVWFMTHFHTRYQVPHTHFGSPVLSHVSRYTFHAGYTLRYVWFHGSCHVPHFFSTVAHTPRRLFTAVPRAGCTGFFAGLVSCVICRTFGYTTFTFHLRSLHAHLHTTSYISGHHILPHTHLALFYTLTVGFGLPHILLDGLDAQFAFHPTAVTVWFTFSRDSLYVTYMDNTSWLHGSMHAFICLFTLVHWTTTFVTRFFVAFFTMDVTGGHALSFCATRRLDTSFTLTFHIFGCGRFTFCIHAPTRTACAHCLYRTFSASLSGSFIRCHFLAHLLHCHCTPMPVFFGLPRHTSLHCHTHHTLPYFVYRHTHHVLPSLQHTPFLAVGFAIRSPYMLVLGPPVLYTHHATICPTHGFVYGFVAGCSLHTGSPSVGFTRLFDHTYWFPSDTTSRTHTPYTGFLLPHTRASHPPWTRFTHVPLYMRGHTTTFSLHTSHTRTTYHTGFATILTHHAVCTCTLHWFVPRTLSLRTERGFSHCTHTTLLVTVTTHLVCSFQFTTHSWFVAVYTIGPVRVLRTRLHSPVRIFGPGYVRLPHGYFSHFTYRIHTITLDVTPFTTFWTRFTGQFATTTVSPVAVYRTAHVACTVCPRHWLRLDVTPGCSSARWDTSIHTAFGRCYVHGYLVFHHTAFCGSMFSHGSAFLLHFFTAAHVAAHTHARAVALATPV